jgi:phage gp29-like protein
MEIGKFNISSKGIYNIERRTQSLERARIQAKHQANDEHKKKAKKARGKIREQTLTRIATGLKNWQNGRLSAESLIMPNNTEKIRVYRDIEIDAHLWALMQTIRLKVMANKFSIYLDSGEIDQEATDKFQKKWFRTIMIATVDAEFYGFSLIQLDDIVSGCFIGSEVIPREYVVQQKGGIKKSLSNSQDLILFDSSEFKNWLIPIGDKDNLGLLDKAAPLVIKKKEVISAWSQAAELFGMPLRIGKTNIKDPDSRENMEDMLENMGDAAWAAIGEDDEIQLVETSKTDFSNMYDKFIERVNSELSKLVLLQTGTTDEKSHVGAASVHENTLKDVIESFIIRVEDVTNEILLPLCVRHGIVKLGSYIKADNEQKFTPKELFDIVKELLSSYDIPDDWIEETFEVPVTKKAEEPKKELKEGDPNKLLDPNASAGSVMKSVANLYEGIIKDCC